MQEVDRGGVVFRFSFAWTLDTVAVGDVVTNLENACLWCCACVESCPSGAQVMSPWMLGAMEWLHDNFSEKREPEIFL